MCGRDGLGSQSDPWGVNTKVEETIERAMLAVDSTALAAGLRLPPKRAYATIRDRGKKARSRLKTAIRNYLELANKEDLEPPKRQEVNGH